MATLSLALLMDCDTSCLVESVCCCSCLGLPWISDLGKAKESSLPKGMEPYRITDSQLFILAQSFHWVNAVFKLKEKAKLWLPNRRFRFRSRFNWSWVESRVNRIRNSTRSDSLSRKIIDLFRSSLNVRPNECHHPRAKPLWRGKKYVRRGRKKGNSL